MMSAPKITFIGAGSTIFVKNILGDVFHREALKTAHIALMDIDPTRLEESHIVVRQADGIQQGPAAKSPATPNRKKPYRMPILSWWHFRLAVMNLAR